MGGTDNAPLWFAILEGLKTGDQPKQDTQNQMGCRLLHVLGVRLLPPLAAALLQLLVSLPVQPPPGLG